ncbi:MAG: AAA family ATPase [Firmicutes bacterium]|nr:AAA family ATPase [Candidatus Colivicinus equi]
MLELNEEKNKYEGETQLSDCEKHFHVLWLSTSGQASLYIGDKDYLQEDCYNFVSGEKECFLNVESFKKYLQSIKEIVKKYSSMFYGPIDTIDEVYNYFSRLNCEDAKIIISYVKNDRYIRILNNKSNYKVNKEKYGEIPLLNGNMFRNSLVGSISKITLWKDNSEYRINIKLIDEWRDKIMQENGKKVDLESLTKIFNNEMVSNISKGLTEENSARVFGIKYAPLLNANSSKFSYEDIVESSVYNSNEIKNAVKTGMEISPIVIWESSPIQEEQNIEPRIHGPQTDVGLNTILYGAPGTGKTYSMPEYAIAIIEKENVDYIKCFYKDKRNNLLEKYNKHLDEGRVVFTTFHQSYGYEDFIQGLRPDVESNELKFKVTDGVFKTIADKALDDPNNNYVIIIDEINRGNISKIFGELITLIEDDKRWGEVEQTSVKLASGDVFTVPNNLYILGTMNSADKSISLVDAALRRRFNFIEIEPNSKLLNDEFSKFLDQINTHLKRELQSKDLLIGHSYFINKSVKDFDNIINKNIIPLLYEYFFDDETKVKKALDGINVVSYKDDEDGKTYVFELEDSNVGRVKCIKKEAADNN